LPGCIRSGSAISLLSQMLGWRTLHDPTVESSTEPVKDEVNPMMAIFGAILPRFVLLVAWSNDGAYWGSLFGSSVWFLGGFLFLPWTTLIYGLVQTNGLSLINWIFLAGALAIDLGTWGIGAFAGRKEYSAYRGT